MNFNPYNTNPTKTVQEFYNRPVVERVIVHGIPKDTTQMYGLINNNPVAVATDVDALIAAFTPDKNDKAMFIKPLMTLASVLASVAACSSTGYAERDTQHVLYAALIAFGPAVYEDIVNRMQLTEEQKEPYHVGSRLAISLFKEKADVKISELLANRLRKAVVVDATIGENGLTYAEASEVAQFITGLAK